MCTSIPQKTCIVHDTANSTIKSSAPYIPPEEQMDPELDYKHRKFIYTATLGIVAKFRF